jgi:hypothetical protein
MPANIPFINTVTQLLDQNIIQEPANVDTASLNAAPYTEYSLNTYYFDDSGKMVLPVSGPPGISCQIVELHAPVQRKLVMWLATRLGSWPVLPDWRPANDNEVFLHKELYLTAPMMLPSASQYQFAVGGTYEYALLVPKPIEQLLGAFAKVPFDLGTYPGITATDFKQVFPTTLPKPCVHPWQNPGNRIQVP